MPLKSLEPLPGPLAFFVGFASEKHDSLERLPGHRHGAGDTALPCRGGSILHFVGPAVLGGASPGM